jgi:hypothetical protein
MPTSVVIAIAGAVLSAAAQFKAAKDEKKRAQKQDDLRQDSIRNAAASDRLQRQRQLVQQWKTARREQAAVENVSTVKGAGAASSAVQGGVQGIDSTVQGNVDYLGQQGEFREGQFAIDSQASSLNREAAESRASNAQLSAVIDAGATIAGQFDYGGGSTQPTESEFDPTLPPPGTANYDITKVGGF